LGKGSQNVRSHHQLETAIRLFLNDGCDMFSEVALADGAGSIFHESACRAGNVPFVDDIVADRSGPMANRSSVMMHGSGGVLEGFLKMRLFPHGYLLELRLRS
jgi:hypothetical protein